MRRGDLAALALALGAAVLFAPALDLPFWNSDDWLHVDLGAGLAAGDPAAWRRGFVGQTTTDAGRALAKLSWGVNHALFGLRAAGYYATNLVIVLATGLLGYVLARQRGAGPAAASAAGAGFLFGAAALQPLYFLAARDDAFAALFAAAALVSWPRLRERRLGALGTAALSVCAGLSKPSAIAQLPLMLIGVELLERRQGPAALSVRGLTGALVATVGLQAALLGLAVDPEELFAVSEAPRASADLLGRRAAALLVPSWALGALSGADALRLGVVVAAGALAAFAGRLHRELLGFGLGVAIVGLLPLAPWLLSAGERGDLGSRYLLLPALGVALACAGLLPTAGKRPGPAEGVGLAVALLAAASWADVGRREITLQDSTSDQLLEVVATAPPGELVIGVRQPDWGTLSLLASPVWARATGAPAHVFLQGTRRLLRGHAEPYDFGAFVEVTDRLDLAAERRTVIWQVPADKGVAWQVRAPTRTPAELGSGLTIAGSALAPTRERLHEVSPWHLVDRLPLVDVGLPGDASGACAIDLALTVSSPHRPRPAHDAALIAGGRFAVATFGDLSAFFLLPLEPRVRLWLPTLAGARGRTLRLLPSNLPGSATLSAVTLHGCAR